MEAYFRWLLMHFVCKNFRGISLLFTVEKVYEVILEKRVRGKLNQKQRVGLDQEKAHKIIYLH